MTAYHFYPFTAVVGQDEVKKAISIALVNPKAGPLLISGKKGTAKTVLARSCQELTEGKSAVMMPLNITEDMLLGMIDIEQAVVHGKRTFLPGVLAKAHTQILYADEVNLFRPELITAALEAVCSGKSQIERDGISHCHEVRCTMIASMNPEEGILSKPVLERFGMYAEMEDIQDTSRRTEIIKRQMAYEADPAVFRKAWQEETKRWKERIQQACLLLPKIEISEAMIQLAAQMCAQAYCAGHHADLYLLETARAIAALAQRTYMLPGDLEEAAVFVLPHRMRRPPEPEPQESPEEESDTDTKDPADSSDEETSEQEEDEERSAPPDIADDREDAESEREESEPPKPEPNVGEANEQIADIDKAFHMPHIKVELGNDRKVRRGSGKRSLTKTDMKQGRYVRAEIPKHEVTDLAFDATIRAAAPYQNIRGKNGCALTIYTEDMRQKVREKRIGTTFLFAVDASGSMGARERMKAVKGAIFYMLQEAYQKRDRVGMIAFRREQADVLLPITRSVDLAQKCLQTLPTGGKTPLAKGLEAAWNILTAQKRKEPDTEAVLVFVTDGRANAGAKDPIGQAVEWAEKIREDAITSVVIDTENDFIKLGVAKKVAAAMGASYFSLQKLQKEEVIHIVKHIGE